MRARRAKCAASDDDDDDEEDDDFIDLNEDPDFEDEDLQLKEEDFDYNNDNDQDDDDNIDDDERKTENIIPSETLSSRASSKIFSTLPKPSSSNTTSFQPSHHLQSLNSQQGKETL